MVIRSGGGAFSEVKPSFKLEMDYIDEEISEIKDDLEGDDDEYLSYLLVQNSKLREKVEQMSGIVEDSITKVNSKKK